MVRLDCVWQLTLSLKNFNVVALPLSARLFFLRQKTTTRTRCINHLKMVTREIGTIDYIQVSMKEQLWPTFDSSCAHSIRAVTHCFSCDTYGNGKCPLWIDRRQVKLFSGL